MIFGWTAAIDSRASVIERLAPTSCKSLCPSRARLRPSITIGCDSQTYTVIVSKQFLLKKESGGGELKNRVLRLETLGKLNRRPDVILGEVPLHKPFLL